MDSVLFSGPNPHNLVGVPGSQNFTFQGIKQGTSIITFNNINPSNQTAHSLTATVTVTAAPKKNITYPIKLLNYGQAFGRVSCEPGWPYGVKFIPTDGSGTSPYYDCAGALHIWPPTGASNQQAYFVNNGWGITLAPTSEMMKAYPSELATLGPGHTQMDDFKRIYVDLMDRNHIKWWLEISLIMDDQSVLTYRTPGYNSTYYNPASGMAKSYEAEFGPAFDFIEHNCSANFQGYTFEQAYTNGVVWLHNRTQYAVAEKDWSGWYNNRDHSGVNVLMGTNPDGTDITPMPTPLQRIGLLDALIIEVYDQSFFDNWAGLLPQVKAAYPNLPIILNVDQVCEGEGWQNGTPPSGNPYETGSDIGWWAPQGLGEPNNRCYTEELWALQRIHYLEELNGKPFDGLIYNFYTTVFPADGLHDPDITWFLQWVDALSLTMNVQRPTITAFVDGGGTQSLNFGVTKDGSRAWVNLLLYAGGNVVNLPNSTATFNVAGISKTTIDNSIFFSQPKIALGDYGTPKTLDHPGFIIRLSPADISGLAAGSHRYTLVVTSSYGTQTFNGVMTVT